MRSSISITCTEPLQDNSRSSMIIASCEMASSGAVAPPLRATSAIAINTSVRFMARRLAEWVAMSR